MARKKKDSNVDKKPRVVKAKTETPQVVEEVFIQQEEPVQPEIEVELPKTEEYAKPKQVDEIKKEFVKKKVNNPAVGYCWNGWEIDSF